MTWAVRHSATVLAVVAVVSGVALMQLPQLRIAISPQSLIVEGSAEQRFYQDTLSTFGSDNITLIYLSDPALFARDKLAAIGNVVDAIDELPFVERTLSLYNLPDVRVVGDQVSTLPYLAHPPRDQSMAGAWIERALRNPFVRGNLLSEDGQAMALNVYLKPDAYVGDPSLDAIVAQRIEQALSPLHGVVEHAYQIGLPHVRASIADAVVHEQYRIVATAFIAFLFVLWWWFRRVSALFIPALTSLLGILWLLGAMAAVGQPLTILTALVPVLLVVVGSTEDVHLMADTFDSMRRGMSSRRAVRVTMRRLSLAIALTFATSCLGFLAVGANPISLVSEFGIVAAVGLAIRFLLTVLLVPALLQRFGRANKPRPAMRVTVDTAVIAERWLNWLLAQRHLVLVVAVAGLVMLAHAASSVRVNNDMLSYLNEDSPIHDRIGALHAKMSGVYTLQVVVDGHIDGAFERVAMLEELQKIQRFVADHPALDHSLSVVDYLMLVNSAVNDNGELELPYEDEVVESLLLFINPNDVREYLSRDHSKASIVVRHGIASSQELSAARAELERFIARNVDPDLNVTVTGESVLSDAAVSHLVGGQMQSLALIMAAIIGLTSLLFVTLKAGLIALVVNLYPVVVLFGVMGWAGIPLDATTSMIAALAVGIGVDHTLHFMMCYHRHSARGTDLRTALVQTVRDQLRAIGAVTLALVAGFAALAWSEFPPVRWFGLLTAMMMANAALVTFVLAPVLLSFMRLVTLWDLLGARVRRELRENCALFHGMSGWQIRRVVLLGQVRRYTPGQRVLDHARHDNVLSVVLSGGVHIGSAGDGPVREAGIGEVLGVVSQGGGEQNADVVSALSEVEVLVFDWHRLERLARFCPRCAFRVFRNLALIADQRAVKPAYRHAHWILTQHAG